MSADKRFQGMKLGDFISQTIDEIIRGVTESQEFAGGNGALVNPPNVNWSDKKQGFFQISHKPGPDESPMITPIEFDVLVTVGVDDSAESGLGVFAAPPGHGQGGGLQDVYASANRIKFQILAKLPQQK